jgi:DNA-binding PadR family transcriptional regulator
MLIYYILHRVGVSPVNGYEILLDIERKTDGAWRPGAGSIYPILKKLRADGLIAVEKAPGGDGKHVYRITSAGAKHLKDAKQRFADFGQKWSAMRGLLIDLIDPEYMSAFIIDGSRKHFQSTQDLIKTKKESLSRAEIEYILKEYVINLERQLTWANQTIDELKVRPVEKRRNTREL